MKRYFVLFYVSSLLAACGGGDGVSAEDGATSAFPAGFALDSAPKAADVPPLDGKLPADLLPPR
jgi:hypothetical protein